MLLYMAASEMRHVESLRIPIPPSVLGGGGTINWIYPSRPVTFKQAGSAWGRPLDSLEFTQNMPASLRKKFGDLLSPEWQLRLQEPKWPHQETVSPVFIYVSNHRE